MTIIDNAREDLHGLLDAIEREMNRDRARAAANAVRLAAEQGKIDGNKYVTYDEDAPECPVCAIGTIGRALQREYASVPGYAVLRIRNKRDFSGFEEMILWVTPGETPATSLALATLVDLLDEWLAAHPVPAVVS